MSNAPSTDSTPHDWNNTRGELNPLLLGVEIKVIDPEQQRTELVDPGRASPLQSPPQVPHRLRSTMPITPQALARTLGTSRAFVRRLIEKGQIATTMNEQGLVVIEQDEAQRVIEKMRADTLTLQQATTPEATKR